MVVQRENQTGGVTYTGDASDNSVSAQPDVQCLLQSLKLEPGKAVRVLQKVAILIGTASTSSNAFTPNQSELLTSV